MKTGDYVQILDNSEWHGLYGTVEEIIDNTPIIFSMGKMDKRYFVVPEVKDKIKVFESSDEIGKEF